MKKFVSAAAVILSLVWGMRPAAAAEIRTMSQLAEDPNSAFKKKIPGASHKINGSTSRIAGSKTRTPNGGDKPDSYLDSKKMTYQERMTSLSAGNHRFKNVAGSSGQRTTAAAARRTQPGGSSGSSLIHPRPAKGGAGQRSSSVIRVYQRKGKPAQGMSRNQPLSESDVLFLGKLHETVGGRQPQVASRLGQVLMGQKQGRLLTKEEHLFLEDLADNVDDGQAAYRLRSIAAKRKDAQR